MAECLLGALALERRSVKVREVAFGPTVRHGGRKKIPHRPAQDELRLGASPALLLRQRQGELDEPPIVERKTAFHGPAPLEPVHHFVLGGAPAALQLAGDGALGECREPSRADVPRQPLLESDAPSEVGRDPVWDVAASEAPHEPLGRSRNQRKHTPSDRISQANRWTAQQVQGANIVADLARERDQTQSAEQIGAVRRVAGEPLVAAVAPERGAGAPPTRLGEQESPGVRVGEIREVPKVGHLLGQRRRDGVVGSRVTHRQLPHPRHVIDPAPLVRGRACEVQRVRLESRPGYVAVANEPGGRPNDRRRVEPPAQEHGDRGDASEPTAHRLAKDLAEVLGVLVVRAIPDLAPRIDVEIACRANTTVLDG